MVHKLVSDHPKSIKLGQMTHFIVILRVVVRLSIGKNLKLSPVPWATSL